MSPQERLYSTRASMGGRSSPAKTTSAAQYSTPPFAIKYPVWQSVTPKKIKNPVSPTSKDYKYCCHFFNIKSIFFKTLIQLNTEDPCIICHEDMSPEDTCVLECRHSFHEEVSQTEKTLWFLLENKPSSCGLMSGSVQCIRSWLKEQSTCPTCRNYALLPEDFPALLGRRRPAPWSFNSPAKLNFYFFILNL